MQTFIIELQMTDTQCSICYNAAIRNEITFTGLCVTNMDLYTSMQLIKMAVLIISRIVVVFTLQIKLSCRNTICVAEMIATFKMHKTNHISKCRSIVWQL